MREEEEEEVRRQGGEREFFLFSCFKWGGELFVPSLVSEGESNSPKGERERESV